MSDPDRDSAASCEVTLAQAVADRYQQDEDFDPDDVEGTRLVSVWWDNDTGMPNWCGGVDLVLLADGSAVRIHRGDSDGGIEPVELPSDDRERAQEIATWLADECHSGFAALDLEPLDPGGTLDEQAKAEWRETIEQSNSYVHVTVGALEPLLRDALGRDAVYARVRDALANPASDEGQLLLTVLGATGDGGSYAYLEFGEWEDFQL